MDEGLSHEEVQFWWTEGHIFRKKVATLLPEAVALVTLELQNGCLALAHSNTFIPSTLAGSFVNPSTGKIDNEKVKEDIDLVIDVYISSVDGCGCGDTCIQRTIIR